MLYERLADSMSWGMKAVTAVILRKIASSVQREIATMTVNKNARFRTPSTGPDSLS